MASINTRKRKAVDFSEHTVAVIVGTAQKTFTLHHSTLVSGSKFFQSALSGPWKESKTQSVCLPETDARVFQSYAAYVYTGEIDVCSEPLDEANDPEARNRFLALAELYVLADATLDDMALRNAVIDGILDLEEKTGYQPSFSTIEHAFENSSGTTPLCRLLIDNALAATHPDWLRSVWNLLPNLYLQELVYGWARASFDKGISYQTPTERPRCDYHEHNDELPSDQDCGSKEKAIAVKLPVKKKATHSGRSSRSRY